ncbi:hypothetical protein BOTBODRAFT_28029 [Botryobasidium botryosum FD-172 SS1]|uniref:enoyl-[acyl-carrier-protein] reductase n=1 Tax=Botryobasidium botryosum (strain FD-172 SS1) TaxID=930990 RepID=A0A067N5P8_BOTB1|nr:hypothetical protein BOTBODRAFT_28029 [Botryobasidium botryosum FD-172 SS1]
MFLRRHLRVTLLSTRHISSLANSPHRAVVYSSTGNPSQVLSARALPPLPPPSPTHLNLRVLLSPINPADINVIEGVYPSKPSIRPDLGNVFIAGNEGLAEVVDVGDSVNSVVPGDWVVMSKPQAGTWASQLSVGEGDVIKVPQGLSEVQAATMSVNPPTALCMLRDFASLSPGDYIVQNGANSAVGQAVIQISAALSLKTINLVRDRPDISELKSKLSSLGATHVLTYDELAEKSTKTRVKEWTSGRSIKLGLNCVGGRDTTLMTGLLGHDAHLVSYGAMSKSPLSLPTSYFIFKNLTSHGFWMSRWYDSHSKSDREQLLAELADMMIAGKLHAPEHEIVTLRGSDEQVSEQVREAIGKGSAGRHGKKVLLRFAEE